MISLCSLLMISFSRRWLESVPLRIFVLQFSSILTWAAVIDQKRYEDSTMSEAYRLESYQRKWSACEKQTALIFQTFSATLRCTLLYNVFMVSLWAGTAPSHRGRSKPESLFLVHSSWMAHCDLHMLCLCTTIPSSPSAWSRAVESKRSQGDEPVMNRTLIAGFAASGPKLIVKAGSFMVTLQEKTDCVYCTKHCVTWSAFFDGGAWVWTQSPVHFYRITEFFSIIALAERAGLICALADAMA